MSDPSVARSRKSRWPFYLSLFLNVVLLTVIVVGAWRVMQWRDGPMSMGMGPWMPRQVERALPEAAREKVRAIREAHADAFKPLFAAVREARDGIRQAMDSEPFAADALSAALADMRRADQAVSEASAKVIVEIASVLTPEERKQVREAFHDKMKERRKGRRDRDGEPPFDEPPPGEGEGMGPPPGEPPPPPPPPPAGP